MKRWLLVAILIALGAGAVWAWSRAPELLLGAARKRIQSDLGADLETASVSVGPGSVTMTEVRLRRKGWAAPIHVAEIRLVASVSELFRGRLRCKEIRIRGVRLDPTPISPAVDRETAVARLEPARALDPGNRLAGAVRKLARAGDLLSAAGTAEIEDVRIESARGVLLVLDRGQLERLHGGLRTAGRVTGGGGTATWDLDIDPEALHATGDLVVESLPLEAVASLIPQASWRDELRGRLDGTVTIRELAVGQSARIEGRMALRDWSIDSPRIAERAIGPIDVELWGRADWLFQENRLDVSTGGARCNGIEVAARGRVAPSLERYLVDLELTLPVTDCNRLFGSIPDAVLGELDAFAWHGSLSGRGRFYVDAERLDATTVDVRLDNRCEFVAIPAIADVARFEGAFEHVAPAAEAGEVVLWTGPGTASWTSLESVSPFLIHAVLAHEDAGFFDHAGFAQYAIEEALEKNLERRRFAFGASTISMQLARNLFLTRDKTLARKVREVLLTWWIEDRWTKSRILELYLNVIEYGPNAYGIRAASNRYFDCEPSELTLAQAVYLATSLPSPVRHDRDNFAAGTLTGQTREQMEFLVRHMAKVGRLTEEARDAALAEIEHFAYERRDGAWRAGMTAELPLDPEPPPKPIDPLSAGAQLVG